jgi:hypothetical protein
MCNEAEQLNFLSNLQQAVFGIKGMLRMLYGAIWTLQKLSKTISDIENSTIFKIIKRRWNILIIRLTERHYCYANQYQIIYKFLIAKYSHLL